MQPDGGKVATTTTRWTYDADGRLTGEVVVDTGTAATPQGLATSFTLPGDYNLDNGSGISMTWDASANAYLMDGMTSAQIGDTHDGIDTAALLAPMAGVAYHGNGSDWVLVVTSQQGGYGVESFTLADGTFSPDGVVSNGGFSNSPSFTVPAASGFNYGNSFSYDLGNNRMQSVHYGPVGGADETITYSYNGDDELTSQTSSLSGATNNYYDPNGSLTSSTSGGVTTTYTYDARNKVVAYGVNGTTQATYVYDDAGNRVQETVGTTTTYYLTDTQNPTGYAQPLEAKASKTAPPTMTYFLGDRAIAQADGSGNVAYLLPDGHGSTEQLADTSVTPTAAFQYDAFGDALNFTPATSIAGGATTGSVFLFGGDAVYDSASRLYLHGDGTRPTEGFTFIQRDSAAGNGQDPLSLHKYVYADADPVIAADPSGHDAGDDAFALADEYQAEEENGMAPVVDFVTNSFSDIGAADALAFAGVASGQSDWSSSSGSFVDAVLAALKGAMPTDYELEISGSVSIPIDVGGFTLSGGLGWEVPLDGEERPSLHVIGGIGLGWGGGVGASVGVGIKFGGSEAPGARTSFDIVGHIEAEMLGPGAIAQIGTAITAYAGAAQIAMDKTDPTNAATWASAQTIAYGIGQNLPNSELSVAVDSDGGVELAVEGGVDVGEARELATFEVDQRIWP